MRCYKKEPKHYCFFYSNEYMLNKKIPPWVEAATGLYSQEIKEMFPDHLIILKGHKILQPDMWLVLETPTNNTSIYTREEFWKTYDCR